MIPIVKNRGRLTECMTRTIRRTAMDTQIEYHGPTDTHGRCHFSLRWIDDYFPGHPEGEHVRRERGQQFNADPRKYGHLRPEEDSDD